MISWGSPPPALPTCTQRVTCRCCIFIGASCARSQSDGLKYIEAPRPELYDTRTDPHETKNLFPGKQAVAHEMRDRLQTLERRYTPASGGGARESEPTDPALADRLRSLGYVAISGGRFSDSSGKALADPKDRVQVYNLFSKRWTTASMVATKSRWKSCKKPRRPEPSVAGICYLQALDYYRLKDYSRAADRLRAALALDPKFALASYYLGLAQLQLGDARAPRPLSGTA